MYDCCRVRGRRLDICIAYKQAGKRAGGWLRAGDEDRLFACWPRAPPPRSKKCPQRERKTMVSSASSAATGAVALLDLPLRSTVGVDGHVIVLQRNDFVGVYGVPSDSRFHLFTARASSSSTTENQTLSALTCGFVVLPVKESEWIVARKYDPHTEEVGSEPLDSLTTENLVKQVQRGQMQQRLCMYFT